MELDLIFVVVPADMPCVVPELILFLDADLLFCAIACVEQRLIKKMTVAHFKMHDFADDKLYCFIVFGLNGWPDIYRYRHSCEICILLNVTSGTYL